MEREGGNIGGQGVNNECVLGSAGVGGWVDKWVSMCVGGWVGEWWVSMWVDGWMGEYVGRWWRVIKCMWSWVHTTCSKYLYMHVKVSFSVNYKAIKNTCLVNITLQFPYGLNLGLFFIIERRAPMTTAANIAMTMVLLHMSDHRGNHWLLLVFTMDAREDTVTCSQERHNHPQIYHTVFLPLNTIVNYNVPMLVGYGAWCLMKITNMLHDYSNTRTLLNTALERLAKEENTQKN